MRWHAVLYFLLAPFLFFNFGCGKLSSPSTTSASSSWVFDSAPEENAQAAAGSGFVSAAHSAFPQVQKGAGAVLATPKIKVVTFNEDALGSSLGAMITAFGASSELTAMVSEYGVGTPTVTTATTSVSSGTTGVVSGIIGDANIRTYLSANFGSSAFLGAADDQTVYVIMFPPSVTISLNGSSSGDFCAQGILGYHDNYTDATSGKSIAYAVILHCFNFPGLDSADSVGTTASHEIVEALTDPHVNSTGTQAYAGLTSAFSFWDSYMPGLELGDMCELFQSSIYKPTDIGFAIQRTWSNAAAAAGHNPCVPSPTGAVYFITIPVVSDTVTFIDQSTGSTTPVSATGVHIPVGTTKTVTLQLFSDAPTSGNWSVSAFEDAQTTASGGTDLVLAFDSTTGSNGTTLHLSIAVLRQDVNWLAEPVWIVSTLNGVKYYWPLLVGN